MELKEVLAFLRKLKENNDRQWFAAHKAEFVEAKTGFEEFLARIVERMIPIEPGLTGIRPSSFIFRIYRDVRFSKNKAPYKTNFGAAIAPGGRKTGAPAYYLHIEPGRSFAGGGVYHPSPAVLKAIRQEIDYNTEQFESLLNEKNFKAHFGELKGEQLKRAPKGYEADNPALKYLKYKDFIVMKPLTDAELLSPDIENVIFHTFKSMKSFNDFLKIPIFEVISGREEEI